MLMWVVIIVVIATIVHIYNSSKLADAKLTKKYAKIFKSHDSPSHHWAGDDWSYHQGAFH